MTLTLKGLLFLIAAIVFAIIALAGLAPSRRENWPPSLAYAAWCLAMVALFLWTAGQ